MLTKDGRSKGYGFVCFSTAEEAQEAIECMNGKEVRSKPIYVTLNKTQPDYVKPSNSRYLQKSIDKQPFCSNNRSKKITDSSESSSPTIPSNRQSPSINYFSTRLYKPIAKFPASIPFDEDIDVKTQRISSDHSISKSTSPVYSSDDDDDNENHDE